MRPVIAVACGVLRRADGYVLIAQRPAGKIAAGKWEFPGGKIEPGESAEAALRRELHEELGIEVRAARPLMRVTHAYSDRRVLLDTWLVTHWDGALYPREQQYFVWCAPDQLSRHDLLAADTPIVKALQLPVHYVFTRPQAVEADILKGLPGLPTDSLLRLRLPALSDEEYHRLAARVLPEARRLGLKLMLDRDLERTAWLGAFGFHFTAQALRHLPAADAHNLCLMASCHVPEELALAREHKADAIVLGPVLGTASHPQQPGLGWEQFAQWTQQANVPVYAIGGMATEHHLQQAFAVYAQGVAGISAYWT